MEKKVIENFLKEVELFKNLNNNEVNKLASSIEVIELKSGEYLFKQNTPRTKIYIIYKGRVKLFKQSVYGTEEALASFTAKDFLSEGALMDDYPHSTSARTMEDSVIFTIQRKKFDDLFDD